MTPRIEDYALIGDCETGALVSRDGSIDWLCWPRFDSGAIFAALLGKPENGRWSIAAADGNARRTRRYRKNTLILETEIETADGAAVVIDFMPMRSKGTSHVVRIVSGTRGTVALQTELTMRFDYGSIVPWVTRHKGNTLRGRRRPRHGCPSRAHAAQAARPDAPGGVHRGRGADVGVHFELWGVVWAVPEPVDAAQELKAVEKQWLEWSGRCTQDGPYKDAVMRSLITLKALTYAPTGGIVAAPTTSLPEQPRRRAQLGLSLLLAARRDVHAARLDELRLLRRGARLARWLLRAVAGQPGAGADHVRPGRRAAARPSGRSRGCRATRARKPVRIGNAAARAAPARHLRRGDGRALPGRAGGLAPSRGGLGVAAHAASSTSRSSGASRTKASGRSAAAAAISPTPR